MGGCMCVCEREGERESEEGRERERERERVCVCVCVWERERQRQTDRQRQAGRQTNREIHFVYRKVIKLLKPDTNWLCKKAVTMNKPRVWASLALRYGTQQVRSRQTDPGSNSASAHISLQNLCHRQSLATPPSTMTPTAKWPTLPPFSAWNYSSIHNASEHKLSPSLPTVHS